MMKHVGNKTLEVRRAGKGDDAFHYIFVEESGKPHGYFHRDFVVRNTTRNGDERSGRFDTEQEAQEVLDAYLEREGVSAE